METILGVLKSAGTWLLAEWGTLPTAVKVGILAFTAGYLTRWWL